MRKRSFAQGLIFLFWLAATSPLWGQGRLFVVGSLPDFAAIAQEIGGEKVEVASIARGNENPHFVLPKPSFARLLQKADLFITTGLDLELWAPTLIDASRNRRIMEGGPGYVAASAGVPLLEVPSRGVDRSAGDIHVYGNPHFHTSPINAKRIAANILAGLQRVDPRNAAYYEERYRRFVARIDSAMFGPELVNIVGGEALSEMTRNGTLMEYLQSHQSEGVWLIDKLGGWLKEGLPFRGQRIIAYHKSWEYFCRDFGLEIVDYVEPKPGIPPTARHVKEVIDEIQTLGIRLLLVDNYYERNTPAEIEARTGVKAVFLPQMVGGEPGIHTVFDLYDSWVRKIRAALDSAR